MQCSDDLTVAFGVFVVVPVLIAWVVTAYLRRPKG